MIPVKMALRQRRIREEESIHGRADGGHPARGRPGIGGAEAARKNKVSELTVYSWRKHFGELAPSDVKRLRTLEAENARLKDVSVTSRPYRRATRCL